MAKDWSERLDTNFEEVFAKVVERTKSSHPFWLRFETPLISGIEGKEATQTYHLQLLPPDAFPEHRLAVPSEGVRHTLKALQHLGFVTVRG